MPTLANCTLEKSRATAVAWSVPSERATAGPAYVDISAMALKELVRRGLAGLRLPTDPGNRAGGAVTLADSIDGIPAPNSLGLPRSVVKNSARVSVTAPPSVLPASRATTNAALTSALSGDRFPGRNSLALLESGRKNPARMSPASYSTTPLRPSATTDASVNGTDWCSSD